MNKIRYPGHVPINVLERSLLTVGSALTAVFNPYRHDMVATLSETFTLNRLPSLLHQMQQTEGGRRILRERPVINSDTVDYAALRKMEEGTLGRDYANWLDRWGVSPDTRDPVRYVDDPTLAYVLQRYRQSHDLYHVLLSFSVSLHSELVVKWFESANLGLPMPILGGLFGSFRLPANERNRLWDVYGKWALENGARAGCLLGIEWEREWGTSTRGIREKLGITPAPMSMKEFRSKSKIDA